MLEYKVYPLTTLRQPVASKWLLVGACICAIFGDMNTMAPFVSIGFPLLWLASICGNHSSGRCFTFGCYFLLPCLCRAIGAIDYFAIDGDKWGSYFLSLLILLPVFALLFGAMVLQKKIWTLQSTHFSPLLFPTLLTAVFQALFHYSPIGAAGNPAMGLAVLISDPMKQVASIVGEIGIVFGMGLLSSCGAGYLVGRTRWQHGMALLGLWFLIQISGGYRLVKDMGLFQTPLQQWPLDQAPTLDTTCLTVKHLVIDDDEPKGDDHETAEELTQSLIRRVNQRLAAGDDLIVVSEAALGQRVDPSRLQWSFENPGAVVAMTYLEPTAHNSTIYYNSVELLQAGQSVLRYDKNRPVPVVEDNVVAGRQPPKPVAITFTPYSNDGSKRVNVTLQVATAICFDFDFPYLQRHARGADLVVGPSDYWASLGLTLWSDNMYRAIESGFTLYKCSRKGMSGAIDPYGRTLAAKPTGAGDTYRTQIPIQKGVSTVFAYYGGYWFGWLCVFASPLWVVYVLNLSKSGDVATDDSVQPTLSGTGEEGADNVSTNGGALPVHNPLLSPEPSQNGFSNTLRYQD